MSTVSEVRPPVADIPDDAPEPVIIPNFNAPSRVDACASLTAWWGECMAVLREMADTAKRIAGHARTEGDVMHYQILPDDLEEFAEEAEKLSDSLHGNPPMPARELRDPTAGLTPVDPAKLAAKDAADATARRVAEMPPELRQRLLQRDGEKKLHLRRTAEEHFAERAPSMEAATSDSLAVLFAAASNFAERYYPTASLIMMSVNFPGHDCRSVSLPLWMPKKGGA